MSTSNGGKQSPCLPAVLMLGIYGALSLSACLSSVQTATRSPSAPAEERSATNAIATSSITISPTTSVETTILPTASPDYLELPTPANDPVRFTFPTPGPAPVSAWRPPLYPTPWAPTPHDHFYFARPIAADEVNWPLPDYRYGGVFLPEVVHTGIDIPAPIGTPVLAAGPGRVVWAGYGLFKGNDDPGDPYGLAVAIKHDFGFQGDYLFTVYGHLSEVDVTKGQAVNAGEQVGLVGQTGKVTGPHLHFEVRVGKNTFSLSQNPELWLAPPIGWGILAARIMSTSGELLESYAITVTSKASGQTWTVKSYGRGPVNSDPYYQENLVLGDLPAGDYTVWIPFTGTLYNLDVRISPGLVSFFTFRGKKGFNNDTAATPEMDLTPPAAITTPIP